MIDYIVDEKLSKDVLDAEPVRLMEHYIVLANIKLKDGSLAGKKYYIEKRVKNL